MKDGRGPCVELALVDGLKRTRLADNIAEGQHDDSYLAGHSGRPCYIGSHMSPMATASGFVTGAILSSGCGPLNATLGVL